MQLLSESEIDLELELGATYRKERIARLRHIVANLERQKKSAEVERWKLVRAMCDQLKFEARWRD